MVCIVGDALILTLPGPTGTLERLPRQRALLWLLVCLSPHQRASVRPISWQFSPAHDRPFRADGGHLPILRYYFLAAESDSELPLGQTASNKVQL